MAVTRAIVIITNDFKPKYTTSYGLRSSWISFRDPLSLSLVRSINREWLNITNSTPRLWMTLILDRRTHFIDLEYVRLYFKNSCSLPLDVSIVCPYWNPPIHLTAFVAAKLSTVVSRMRSLSITTEDYFGSGYLTGTIRMGQPAPLLESLRIRITEYRSYQDHPAINFFPLRDSFTPSPKLKILEISLFRMILHHLPHLSTATTLMINANKSHGPQIALDVNT